MGDSFASGEGNPPFDAGACHRSEQAYPRVFAERSDILVDHVACSGATISDVEEGQNDEPPQVDALTETTDLVSTTIGGNDVYFARVLRACVFNRNCHRVLDPYVSAAIDALGPRLEAHYVELKARAENAKIFVLAYPHLFPPPHLVSEGCSGISKSEMAWFREKTADLFNVIAEAVRDSGDAPGGELFFVQRVLTAFKTHELCTPDPWINPIVPSDLEYSFHPNTAGHQALADSLDSATEDAGLQAGDWPSLHFDSANSGFNPWESSIGPGNVGELQLLWTVATDESSEGSPVVGDGVLYLGVDDTLLAINTLNGQEIWRAPGWCGWYYAGPTVADGVVYGPGCAFDSLTGEALWSGGPAGPSPVVVGGVLYGITAGYAYALDTREGSEIWRFEIEHYSLLYSPAVANGIVYIGSGYGDGNVYALDALTGEEIWRSSPDAYDSNTPAVVDGVVYVGHGNSVFAMDALTGQVLWESYLGCCAPAAPSVANGRVYAPLGQFLYCLDAATGNYLWSLQISPWPGGGLGGFGPSVANGVVYSADEGDGLLALDAVDGDLLWIYPSIHSMEWPPVVAGGKVYLAQGFTLYAFGLP